MQASSISQLESALLPFIKYLVWFDLAFSVKIFYLSGGFNIQCVYHLLCDKCEKCAPKNGKRCILTAVGLRFCCQYKRLTNVLTHSWDHADGFFLAHSVVLKEPKIQGRCAVGMFHLLYRQQHFVFESTGGYSRAFSVFLSFYPRPSPLFFCFFLDHKI